MDKRTLKALKGSIAKWQKIVLGTGVDLGDKNCPLCNLFLKHGCDGCPVSEKTQSSWCDDSPYQGEWFMNLPHRAAPSGGWKASTPELREAALHELLFLESLLPKRGGRNVG